MDILYANFLDAEEGCCPCKKSSRRVNAYKINARGNKMGLPKSVAIYEVGPREGVQMEEPPVSTTDKISLINALSQTGLRSIEVTSFVSPKWVPQMADAEKVLANLNRVDGVAYRAVYLNTKGLERALSQDVVVDGFLGITASETFSKKNTNKTVAETVADLPNWLQTYKRAGIPVEQVLIMTAFGCNYEGEIPLSRVLDLIAQAITVAEGHGENIASIKLTDTMGWANPEQMKRTIDAVSDKWPNKEIQLHLHDTRGLGLANVYAALQEGVRTFDSALGGLGGCPFAATKGAAGNIATEDLVFLCEEMGIDTGVDLAALIQCVYEAERIFGRSLPGHVAKGGLGMKHAK